ncbi:MAG: CDP-glycerol glycerophosphotransferase family protein [Candidatus Nanopelagicales bacterium]|nr:CDP-glycerol glycerophosphotransferase family protein [Candidatus Nanopelagicales bacterium]
MSEAMDVSIVLTKRADLNGAFADQTLRNLEVVSSLDEVRGTWVMFAPPFFGYERHIMKNLLLAGESSNADVVVGAVKGPWVPTTSDPWAFAEVHSQVPSTHAMFRASWLKEQSELTSLLMSDTETLQASALGGAHSIVTIPQDVVAKPMKKAANPKNAKGSPFKNMPALGYFIAKYLPLKNEVLFDVEGDRAVDTALPALAEQWKQLNPGVKQKWITPKLRDTWTHAWHLGRAKYLVTNEVFLNRIPKREGQVMAVAGVGIPVLRVGRDNPDWVLQPTSERRPAWSQVGRWDVAIAASPFAEQVLRSSTAYVSEVVQASPFADAMLDELRDKDLATRLGIDPARKLAVCAFFTSQSASDLTELQERHGSEVQFVGVTDDCSTLRLPTGVQQVATDLPLWLAAADVLITDWSSLLMEFGRLQRPVIAIQPNRVDVVRRRGTYLDLPAVLPGPIVEDQAELLSAVEAWLDNPDSVPNYADRRSSFAQLCGAATGDSAQRIWAAMVSQS